MEGTERSAGGARPGAPERFPFTKFLPPVLDERVVTEHLVDRLDAATTRYPLTVLVAPAGSGKTTALAAWAEAATSQVVWVRLDTADDEPTALAAALLEAGRRTLGATFGGRVARLLAYAGAAPTSRQLVTSLVNDLGDHGPTTLVFDDVHAGGAAVAGLLDDLLDHLPPQVRVVLASRVEPACSLARRRVRGELGELGLDDLRLDREAVRRVLAHDGAVPDDQVDAVLTSSGGWAAAVRLATAHVGDGADGGDGSAPRVVAEVLSDLRPFLTDEVLAALPDGLQRFLLETSILDELTPVVCDAVTGRNDSDRVLAELDRRNLFVARHRGARGDSWRTHDLFASFLGEELHARRDPEEVAELHRRAATAFPPLRALPHLLAAGDDRAAATMLTELGTSNLDIGTLLRIAPLIRALPPEVRDTDHWLTLLLVVPAQLSGQAHEVVAVVEPLRDRLLAEGDEAAAAEVNGTLAEVYLQLGDLAAAGAALEQALAHEGPSWHRPMTLAVATWWHWFRGDWDEASRANEEALRLVLRSGDPNLAKAVGPGLSPLLLFANRGPAWLADTVDQLVAILGEDDHATLTAMRPVRAGAALLRLDVTGAITELRACLAESTGYGRIAWKHQEAEALLLSICLGTGDLTTVQHLLDDALPRLDAPVYRQYRHPYVHAAMRTHWLAGEHRQVRATYEQFVAGVPPDGQAADAVMRAVGQGMVARIEGRTDDALAVLLAGEEAQRDGRCWLWVGLPGLDRANVLLEAGRAAAAIEAALPTLEVAATFGAGVLLPEARANRTVLERCLRAGIHTDLLRAVLATTQPDGSPRGPVAIPGSHEVLSTREVEVLAAVATGASNREVADGLFISEATVKSHLTRVLRKLEVSSRTQAAARARELRLL